MTNAIFFFKIAASSIYIFSFDFLGSLWGYKMCSSIEDAWFVHVVTKKGAEDF